MGLTSAVQPATHSKIHSGSTGAQWPNSIVATPGNIQLAIGDHPHILPVDTSSTIGIGVATKMPKTGGSSSLFAHTSSGPVVVMSCVAPMGGGSHGVSMSSPGPTQSQASRASFLEMD